jgi:hypothetical protein
MNLSQVGWRKSRRSTTGNGCVEVAELPDAVWVRDSKLGDASPVLVVTRDQWRAFVRTLR